MLRKPQPRRNILPPPDPSYTLEEMEQRLALRRLRRDITRELRG